jgi:hypothetical protein
MLEPSTGQHDSSSKYGRRTIDETYFPPRNRSDEQLSSHQVATLSSSRKLERSRAFRWSFVCLSTKVDHIIDYGNVVGTLEVRSEIFIEILVVVLFFANRMAEPLLESAWWQACRRCGLRLHLYRVLMEQLFPAAMVGLPRDHRLHDSWGESTFVTQSLNAFE